MKLSNQKTRQNPSKTNSIKLHKRIYFVLGTHLPTRSLYRVAITSFSKPWNDLSNILKKSIDADNYLPIFSFCRKTASLLHWQALHYTNHICLENRKRYFFNLFPSKSIEDFSKFQLDQANNLSTLNPFFIVVGSLERNLKPTFFHRWHEWHF